MSKRSGLAHPTMSHPKAPVKIKSITTCRRIRIHKVNFIQKSRPSRMIWVIDDSRLNAKEVTQIRLLGTSQYAYPVCPGCRMTIDREYQSYCDRCGQKLVWIRSIEEMEEV